MASPLDGLTNLLATAGKRFTTNIQSTFSNLTPEKWIRLVIIVGAYMLLRPFLMKLGEKLQMRAHGKDSEEDTTAKAAISPNQLRGQVQIPEDSSDEDDDDEEGGAAGLAGRTSGADWGKKARRRQRAVIRKLLEAEERKLQESKEEEEDKDIEEFLVQ